MVRQHDGQCQSSTGYQGVAQGAFIADDGIIISDEEGIVLTLKEILKGKNENYKVE